MTTVACDTCGIVRNSW